MSEPMRPPQTNATAPGGSREAAIREALDDLRPYLQRDGGDCELVGVDGDAVRVRLSGACVGCQFAAVTLEGVRGRLADTLGRPIRVIPVPGGAGPKVGPGGGGRP